MFLMYDSVTLSEVPANPHAVGCYRNGHYANEAEARRRFPHAYILPISVTGDIPCPAYDIEPGDYRPEDVPRLFGIAHAHGIWRPVFYASLSNWPALTEAFNSHGIPRFAYRKWSAHYDGTLTFDGDEDAKQLTDRALGRNLDESICRDGFFPPPPHPVVHKPLTEEQQEYNVGFQAGFRKGWIARGA